MKISASGCRRRRGRQRSPSSRLRSVARRLQVCARAPDSAHAPGDNSAYSCAASRITANRQRAAADRQPGRVDSRRRRRSRFDAPCQHRRRALVVGAWSRPSRVRLRVSAALPPISRIRPAMPTRKLRRSSSPPVRYCQRRPSRASSGYRQQRRQRMSSAPAHQLAAGHPQTFARPLRALALVRCSDHETGRSP